MLADIVGKSHFLAVATKEEWQQFSRGNRYIDIETRELLTPEEAGKRCAEYKERGIALPYHTKLFTEFALDGVSDCGEWMYREFLHVDKNGDTKTYIAFGIWE